MTSNLDSLQKLLAKKAIFVDAETFEKASLSSEQARTIKRFLDLHMEELRTKQDEISKRDKEIKLLEAVIQTLGGRESLPAMS